VKEKLDDVTVNLHAARPYWFELIPAERMSCRGFQPIGWAKRRWVWCEARERKRGKRKAEEKEQNNAE
jgi:hypothetical protein